MITSNLKNNPIAAQYRSISYKDIAKKVEAPSRHEAFVLFENAKKRLNDINNWQLFCGKSPAEFQLTDNMGNLINACKPQINNLIKVRFNAPSSKTDNTYIWYKIENFISEKNLLKDTEDFGFNVVQVSGPFANGNTASNSGITCTFLVTRIGCSVSAVETEKTKSTFVNSISPLEKLKNKAMDIFSMINSSNHQWKSLVNGVLQY